MHTVQRWMTCPAIVVPPTCTLPEARQLMADRRIRRLPVVDAQGHLVGIVSEGDLNRISASSDTDVREFDMYRRIQDLPLQAIMTRQVFTVEASTPLALVARLLQTHRIGGLPVVEAGAVIGMITESDLFRYVLATEQADLERVNSVNNTSA